MIKKFTDILNENFEPMNFDDAFNEFIAGQTITSPFFIQPYGNNELPTDEKYYGDGITLENGYKMISHGGGCGGEDCNTTFIIDPDNKLIAKKEW